jgi:pyruvate dehydrogenase E1 component alpha subunit
VLAVHAATESVAEDLRTGSGPHLIECLVDRWEMHASRHVPMPDGRDRALLDAARERDPIARLSSRMQADGILDEAGVAAVRADVDRELESAIAFAEESPHPEPEAATEDVFV